MRARGGTIQRYATLAVYRRLLQARRRVRSVQAARLGPAMHELLLRHAGEELLAAETALGEVRDR